MEEFLKIQLNALNVKIAFVKTAYNNEWIKINPVLSVDKKFKESKNSNLLLETS